MQGVYQIKNLVDRKIYVGSTLNFKNRKAVHFASLRNKKHGNPYFQNAFIKHGEKNFLFEVLEETIGLNSIELLVVEQRYFDSLRPFDRSIGYNIKRKNLVCFARV